MKKKCLFGYLLVLFSAPALAGEWSGYIGGDFRYFPDKPLDREQFEHTNFSVAIQPEYAHEWDGGKQQFVFTPFLRVDQNDPQRTHFDIRELFWSKASDDWELKVGVGQVFWGVTEFLHLVDIINQTDEVENPNREKKLGQPMINYALIRDWGTVNLFVLPGFRERTFVGPEGRPRGPLYVDTDQTEYESSAEQAHVDFAIRWSHSIGNWDVGLSHFYGTTREPLFRIGANGSRPVLIPIYDIINQTGLDVQFTSEEWLWKLEAISRSGQGDQYTAATGGFEYTFVGIFESDIDLGLIGEYAYDSRGDQAQTPFENDFVIGTRFAFNDTQSTELLAGFVFDAEKSTKFYTIEGSRRLGDSTKISLEARLTSNIDENDPVFVLRNEDFIQLEVQWFF